MVDRVERILGDGKENKGSFKFFAICENIDIKTSQINNPYTVLSLVGYNGCRKDFVVFEILNDSYKNKLLIVDINYSSTGGTYKIVDIKIKEDSPQIKDMIIPPVSESVLNEVETNIKKLLENNNLNLFHLIEPLKSESSSLFLYRRGEMFVQLNNMLIFINTLPISQKEKITAFKVAINLYRRFETDITSMSLKDKINFLSVLSHNQGDGVDVLLEVLSDFLELEKARNTLSIIIVNYLRMTIQFLELSLVDRTLTNNQIIEKPVLGYDYEIRKLF